MKHNTKPVLLFITLAVLLLATLACGTSAKSARVSPVAPVVGTTIEAARQGPCTFSSTGDNIAGWNWLRDAAYTDSGQWNCRGLPTDQDLMVSLQTLVTNVSGGGSGYSSPVKITYTNPAGHLSKAIQIYLQNQLAEQSPENSGGVGYPTTGYFVIPKGFIDADGGLLIRLERFKPNPFHVAINGQSISFEGPHFADSFTQSKGLLVADWYWLRDAAREGYGEWNFKGLNPAAPATLALDLLVTDKASGGSGFSMPVQVTLINPSNEDQKTFRHVLAQNLTFKNDPTNSGGVGYQTYGSIALDASFIDASGNLTVRIARLSNVPYHLALNQHSVTIVQPVESQGLATPSPTALTDSSQGGPKSPPEGKYLFIQYWNIVDGTGKLPALAIDFPGYRFDPKTGILSPFNPAQAIKLDTTAWGFIGHGISLSGDAGTGASSSLRFIDQLPFSTEVAMFTGSVNLQAGPNMTETKPVVLKVLSVADDGTISIELDNTTLTLAPGKSWKQTIDADVNKGGYKGHLTMTSTLTNYGWQDRSKMNLLP